MAQKCYKLHRQNVYNLKFLLTKLVIVSAPHWPIIRKCCCAKRSPGHSVISNTRNCGEDHQCVIYRGEYVHSIVMYVAFYIIVYITTNKCTINVTTVYIKTVSFYTLLHVSTFLCHHQGILRLCPAKLHKFLKLKLLITIP